MSGPNERVTAGETSPDDSSSRHRMAQNPRTESTPQLKEFCLQRPTTEQLSESRDVYISWISNLSETLSTEGQALVRTNLFDQLKEVPNSTVAHSRAFNHVDLTRWDHCIHAAHTVGALGAAGRLGLSPYELKVLELVMLLHDPHRLGSHALDRVFAAMPGAPEDFNSWWPKNDYHEYHGARLVASDPAVKPVLGKYYDDVLAILTYDDRRSADLKDADYGEIRCKLNPRRLGALHRLKDEIDRCSYLKLDYLRSGFKLPIVTTAIADVERHERTLRARGGGLQLHIDDESGPRPYDDVGRLRHAYREQLATLPVGCLAEQAIFHNGVWDKALERFDARHLETPEFYAEVRDKALKGDYDQVYSEEALALLRAAKTGRGLCVEDVYAPLVTMTLADMTETRGVKALEECLPHGLSKSLCGIPRRDMTLFEAGIREALTRAGLQSNVHILTSNDFGKRLEYDVSRSGGAPEREVTEHHCHPSLIKVIVAARAINKNGVVVDLSKTKEVVQEFLRNSGYLINNAVLDNFNPRVFCDPVSPLIFSPSIRLKIDSMTPVWIKRGGCGLL